MTHRRERTEPSYRGAMSRLRLRIVSGAAKRLTARQLIALAWHHHDGLSQREIASRMGICPSSANGLLARGRANLRASGLPLPARPASQAASVAMPPLEMDRLGPDQIIGQV